MGFLSPTDWSNALSSDPTGSIQAANIQAESSANQLALQKAMWNYQQEVQAPFVQSGQMAANDLMYQTRPGGYFDQWTMDKMKESVPYQTAMDPTYLKNLMSNTNAAAAASGSFGSPGVANAIASNLQQNALNAGSAGYQQWSDAYNRLVGRANSNAAQQVASQGGQYATNASNTMRNTASSAGYGVMGAAAGRNSAQSNMGSGIGNYLTDLIKQWASPSTSKDYMGDVTTQDISQAFKSMDNMYLNTDQNP